jgi:hypothetical protein
VRFGNFRKSLRLTAVAAAVGKALHRGGKSEGTRLEPIL